MKVTVLVENTSPFRAYQREAALSLYITTRTHRILFDCGSGRKFSQNAQAMGIDLRAVDLAIISHAHSDHGGGLDEFLRINPTAPVYVQKAGFGKYYAKTPKRFVSIGLNRKFATNPRFVLLDGPAVIGEGLRIVAHVPPKKAIHDLFMKTGQQYVPDTFAHEQSLVISENGKNVLVSGCSHCGIERILVAARESCGKIDTVLGGFHLIAYDLENPEDLREIDALADSLLEGDSLYYTCHCTSTKGYTYLKKRMGERIGYLSTGSTIFLS